ncbi:hypothetical protein MMC29_001486 [Sticta canariensis]|nr:hypothetical protein [Sticta canariensis]
MAAAAFNTLYIDPAKQAKYPITISEQLLGEVERGSRQHALLHFNHKPKLSNSPHETTISPSPSHSDNSCNLSIKVDSDGNGYSYTGSQRGSEACALIYDPQSQTLRLDKISTEFSFNLHATPTNKSSKALASQYPHIPTGDSEPESNSDDPSTGADVNNPYDYRHFLKRRRTSSPEPLPSTPLVPTSPPRHAPVRPKPKPRPRPQQNRAPSPPPREEADADNEDSDDGGLTIELDPDVKPRRTNPAFTHDISKGPISLRSAASSVSPAVSVSSDEDEDVEQLILEPSNVVMALTPGKEEKGEAEEEKEEAEEEEEEEEGEEEDDDDEGSLEAELEQALESQADEDESGGVQIYGNGVVNGLGLNGVRTEMPVNPVVDESSSESEEE